MKCLIGSVVAASLGLNMNPRRNIFVRHAQFQAEGRAVIGKVGHRRALTPA
jgi:hypothetical protein